MKIYNIWILLFLLSTFNLNQYVAYSNHFPAWLLPEFVKHLPPYPKQFTTINHTNKMGNKHEIDVEKISHLYELLDNNSRVNGNVDSMGNNQLPIFNKTELNRSRIQKRQKQQLINETNITGPQLQLMNDRILMLLAFNNLLFELISNIDDSQKELKTRLLQRIGNSKLPSNNEYHRHHHHETDQLDTAANTASKIFRSATSSPSSSSDISKVISTNDEPSKQSFSSIAAKKIYLKTTSVDALTNGKMGKIATSVLSNGENKWSAINSPNRNLLKAKLLASNLNKSRSMNTMITTTDMPQMSTVKNGFVNYNTDSRKLFGSDLGEYLDTIRDKKRIKIMLNNGSNDEEPSPVDSTTNNSKLFINWNDTDWIPVNPLRISKIATESSAV
ncbi:hypothetical protein BLOT_012804 [Blomia tropicalis]|nr:hypothetical protein BLOT_012804 [Blomia tropicalis]